MTPLARARLSSLGRELRAQGRRRRGPRPLSSRHYRAAGRPHGPRHGRCQRQRRSPHRRCPGSRCGRSRAHKCPPRRPLRDHPRATTLAQGRPRRRLSLKSPVRALRCLCRRRRRASRLKRGHREGSAAHRRLLGRSQTMGTLPPARGHPDLSRREGRRATGRMRRQRMRSVEGWTCRCVCGERVPRSRRTYPSASSANRRSALRWNTSSTTCRLLSRACGCSDCTRGLWFSMSDSPGVRNTRGIYRDDCTVYHTMEEHNTSLGYGYRLRGQLYQCCC